MKNLFLIFLLFFSFFYNNTFGQVGLIARYELDGNPNDNSSNANHGTIVGNVTATKDRFGNCNKAMKFGGFFAPGSIVVPNNSSFNISNELTLTVWVRFDSFTGNNGSSSSVAVNVGATHTIIGKRGDGIAVDPGYYISISDQSLGFVTTRLGASTGVTNTGISLNIWKHIAIVATTTQTKTYLDGVLVNTVASLHNFTNSNSQILELGRMGGVWYPFNGALDDVRILNRALNDSEILAISNEPNNNTNSPMLSSISNNSNCTSSTGSITLNSTYGTISSYTWNNGITNSSGAGNTINNLSSGTYNITATFADGCSSTTIQTITVSSAPTINISTQSSKICDGTSTELTASGGITYKWSNNATSNKTSISQQGTYSVTATNGAGCTSIGFINIDAYPKSTVSITTKDGLFYACNQPLIINASAGFSNYLWNTGATTPNIIAPTLGSYSVVVTDANGCTASNSETVYNGTPLNYTLSPPNPKICTGSNLSLSVIPNSSAINYSYKWANGTKNSFLDIIQAGTYKVTISNGQCTKTDSIKVDVLSGANISINGNTSICSGQSTTLTAISASPSQVASYRWSYNNASSNTITVNSPSTYTVTITYINGCTNSASVVVSTSNILNTSIQGTTKYPVINNKISLCQGDNVLVTAIGGDTFLWNNGQTSSTLMISKAGNYAVSTTSTNGCIGQKSVDVTVNPIPSVKINAPKNFCDKQIATLKANGTGTFLWNTGSNNAEIQTSNAGKYSVTISDKGCSSKDSLVLVKNALPKVEIQGDSTVCNGAAALLEVKEKLGNTFLWNTKETTAKIEPIQSGSYIVTIVDTNGCANSKSINVINVASLTPKIVGKTQICESEKTLLKVNGNSGWTYVWNNNSKDSTLSVSTTGTYSVTATNAKGCKGTATHDITVNPIPSVKINAPKSFCDKQVATLKANGTGTLLWNTGSSNAEIQTSSAGKYSVTISDKGCSSKDSVVLIKNALPKVEIQGDSTLCNGSTTTLSVPVGMVYQWNTTATSESIQVNQPGTYSLTVTDKNGCTNNKSINVKAATNLPLSIAGKNVLCKGESLLLKAVGNKAWSYIWNNIQKDSILNVTNAGTYTVIVTNSKGCTGTASIDVTAHDVPTLNISGKNNICHGETANLKAETNATTFKWSTGTIAQNFSTTAQGTYSVTVTNDKGCSASGVVAVSIAPLPSPTIGGTPLLCSGNPTTLKAEGGIFDKYLWSTGETTKEISAKNVGTYLLTVTTIQGCTASKSINISNGTALNVVIIGKTEFCKGQSILLKASGGDSYSWSNNNSSDSILINKSGTYSVTATSNSGCTGVKNVIVKENPLPQGIFSGDLKICKGDNGVLSISGGVSYLWNNGKTNSSIGFNKAETFTVTITDNNLCTSTSSQKTDFYPSMNPMISGATTLCGTQTTNLSVKANGANTFLWNTGESNPIIKDKKAGVYKVITVDANGCKDSASIVIKSSNFVETHKYQGICEGTIYEFSFDNKKYYYAKNGIYEHKTTTASGCDSLLKLHITVETPSNKTIDTTICAGKAIKIQGKDYTQTGVYNLKLISKNGCDSLITLKLTVLDSKSLHLSNKEVFLQLNTKDTAFNIFPKNNFISTIKINVIEQPENGKVSFDTLFRYRNPEGFKNTGIFTYKTTYTVCPNVSDVAEVTLSLEPTPNADDCITKFGDKIYNGITPNGNGKNEYFDPLGDLIANNCPLNPNFVELRIINPWGDVIFRAKPYQKWFGTRQGTPDGTPVENGIYYYVLITKTPNDKKEKSAKGKLLVIEPK